ncbi:MAG TPA: AmmeMemoRadiSam system protein A [Tepidisphaeraceae bacterium]|jgi:AmmeMemoRadiSam system protein A|nr:AmmeMemoRadiSam system protein A [Tepidisphaeraceae bacterium]
MTLSGVERSHILDLARAHIRRALRVDNVVPEFADEVLRQPAGCFVTLHTLHGRRLRGCVGRIDASQPLAEALHAASLSVLRDPRFSREPILAEELAWLEIEVSVLSAPWPASHALDFEPLEQGIYLTVGERTGCFLPQVARETGWTREQLLDRLCLEKLGLPAGTWRQENARLHVFSTIVVGPEEFEPAVHAGQIGKHQGHG